MKRNKAGIGRLQAAWMRVWLSSVILLGCGVTFAAEGVVSIHKSNFFLFQKGNDVLYPVGINSGGFLDPTYPEAGIEFHCKLWSESGANTLRINLDDFHAPTVLRDFENGDGTLKEAVLQRLDRVLTIAQAYKLDVILGFYDVETMVKHWDEHPYNRKNGGLCDSMGDFFTSPAMLGRATKRVNQVVDYCKGRNIFAWELARGINIWELGMKLGIDDLPAKGEFWVFRMADMLRRTDQEKRLLALSYAPNTLPLTLAGAPLIQINLLHIQAKDPYKAAEFTPTLIHMARDYKKPVFVAETSWTGSDSRNPELVRNIFWSSVASCSGTFLSASRAYNENLLSDEELTLIKTLVPFVNYADLSGPPRPPSVVPILLEPPETFLLVEGMLGKDWIFWILRNQPGETAPRLTFRTVEGVYEYSWFPTDHVERAKSKPFSLKRKEIMLQCPSFGHDILGVLRLEHRAPQEKKDSANPDQG